MRRAALLWCLLGCYPSSELTLPAREGYFSRILLGSDRGSLFAHASESDVISFSASDDLILEALLYDSTLAELGLAEGPIPVLDEGRPPPLADAVKRTTIDGGEFSGWDDVAASELSSSIRIPHFDANACTGCITSDENGNPICKIDCAPADPIPPSAPLRPQLDPIAIPPDCPPELAAYVGETECHSFGPCPADGWPAVAVDAYVRPGSSGNGSKASPYGTVPEAIAAGASRIALSAGTHEFDGFITVPIALFGACAEQTIVVAVLRMREDLILHDVTVRGGIETCRTLDIHRVHLHGGPMLGERATITASDLALHDSHIVLADSEASFERLFVSSDLASFTCWGSEVEIDNAVLSDRGGRTLTVNSTCTLDISNALLRPYERGVVVAANAHLTITDARIEGREGGILVLEGATAAIARVQTSGDEGLEVAGSAVVIDSIIESIDRNSGAALINAGLIEGARIDLVGGKRGIYTSGRAILDDVTVETEALGAVIDLDGELTLSRASITARVICIEALSSFTGEDLLLSGCETGISSSAVTEGRRIRGTDVGTGAAIFAASLTLDEVRFGPMTAGVVVASGNARIRSFVIEGDTDDPAIGAELADGTLLLERGRLQDLGTGLVLPGDTRVEQVLNEVSLVNVSRVFETR